MPTETLHFENARLAQQLFNNDPRNLQSLEEHLGVKAVARENWIKLEGPSEGVELAKELLQSLETGLKNGGTVRNLAHAVNAFRAYAELPILADALEEAGCDDSRILRHLRARTKGHDSRCWVLKRLLA